VKQRVKAESIEKYPPPRGSTHEMAYLYILDEKGNELIVYLPEKVENQLKAIYSDIKRLKELDAICKDCDKDPEDRDGDLCTYCRTWKEIKEIRARQSGGSK